MASTSHAYTENQLIEQPAIQFFTGSLPRLLLGQVELADFFDVVLP